MDSLKKPEMLLSLGNTAALIAVVVYYQRQIATKSTEDKERDTDLKTVVRKVTDLMEQTKHVGEFPVMLDELGKVTAKLMTANKDLNERLYMLEDQISLLTRAINEYGIPLPQERSSGRSRNYLSESTRDHKHNRRDSQDIPSYQNRGPNRVDSNRREDLRRDEPPEDDRNESPIPDRPLRPALRTEDNRKRPPRSVQTESENVEPTNDDVAAHAAAMRNSRRKR